MTHESNETYLECSSVRLGMDGAAEMDRNRRHIWIPREQIARLELSYGSAAERPLVALLLGIVLVLVSLFGPAMLVLAILGHGSVPGKLVTTIAFIVPAFWLVDLALRRRSFLTVHTTRGRRKLLFTKGSDPVALERFVMSAKAKFGYP